MIEEDAVHVLRFCLVLFIAWLIWYQFWIPYRMSIISGKGCSKSGMNCSNMRTREHVAFTHPAYTDLRLTINALIRHGHRVTILRIVMSMVSLARSREITHGEWRH